MPDYPNIKLRAVPDAPSGPLEPAECDYAELEAVTNFSFLRGASHADELVFRATQLGYRALGITDVNSLAGIVRAWDACRQVKEQGGVPPKLIVGARLCFDQGPDLLVWAPDRKAYGKLCRLLTLGKRRAEKGERSLTPDDFFEMQEGMLAAVAMPLEARRHEDTEARTELERVLDTLKDVMRDRVSLAASCLYGDDDRTHLDRLARSAKRAGVPLFATNCVHYHAPERRALQDVLTCVRHGCTVADAGFRLFPNGERYLKEPGRMARLFADHPAALRRGLEIAERCTFDLAQLRYEYPDELAPQGMAALEYLTHLAWTGAATRYPGGVPDKVRRQIEHELKLIAQLRYEAYFLTVYDIVKYARSRGILCQGRGSAANSAVCYCIGVTSVDPARIDVLFERFVSAARNEPPDIDVDFEHERREEVIQYVYQKYGRDRAGMTAEVITYRGRSAVRDVGKALGLSLDMVDSMAKKLDWWHRGTLEEPQLKELGLDGNDPTIRMVISLTGQLLGFPRHLSQHVGGMVMTRGPLNELVPIENASMPDRTVIEWDKDDIDSLGILKVDCLALGMLTCISKAFTMIDSPVAWAARPCSSKCTGEPPVPRRKLELRTVPPEDPIVYDMICDADTVGVFQVESRAQMSMLPRLRPRKFYDLVIEVAIVRPGPIQGNMVHPYLKRRHGEEPVTYPSEALREVMEKTLGVPLFQEQAMRIAMVGAGFSADEADRLRKAMAAWRKHGAIDAFHQKIVQGMLANGYTREFAEQCFLQIRGFGEYGFPESHAASFALLVYVSSWIKRYHPAAFCAALLNSQPMGFYAPAQIVRDAREHGVEVLPADVNESDWDCTLVSCSTGFQPVPPEHGLEARATKYTWGLDGPAVRLGFRQIKGIKQKEMPRVVETRQRIARFTSVEQFHRTTGVTKSTVRLLAEADAFISLGLSRRQALWRAMALDGRQLPLFDEAARDVNADLTSHLALPPMPLGQEVMTDYRTTALSLKKHPVSLVRPELTDKGIITTAEMNAKDHGKWASVAGLVLIRQRPGTASGIVFETIEDETGIVNLIVRPNIYDRFRPAARHATLLHAQGYVERQGQVVHLMVFRMADLSDMLAGYRFASRDFH